MFLLVKGDVFFGANSWKLGTGCTEGGAVTGFRFTSGGCQFQAVIPEDGLWTLYAVVGQGGDSAVSSGILVDNVRLHQVPEPSTLALIGFALAGLAFPRRRKQKSRDCSDQPARVAGLASQSSAPGSRIQ